MIQQRYEIKHSNNQRHGHVQEKIIEELKSEIIEDNNSVLEHGSELSGITENNISENDNDADYKSLSQRKNQPYSSFIEEN